MRKEKIDKQHQTILRQMNADQEGVQGKYRCETEEETCDQFAGTKFISQLTHKVKLEKLQFPLHWQMHQKLKEQGVAKLDLSQCNQAQNDQNTMKAQINKNQYNFYNTQFIFKQRNQQMNFAEQIPDNCNAKPLLEGQEVDLQYYDLQKIIGQQNCSARKLKCVRNGQLLGYCQYIQLKSEQKADKLIIICALYSKQRFISKTIKYFTGIEKNNIRLIMNHEQFLKIKNIGRLSQDYFQVMQIQL